MKGKIRLSYRDRVVIQKLIEYGTSYTGIGLLLNKHRNSIAMEVNRTGKPKESYSALQSQLLMR